MAFDFIATTAFGLEAVTRRELAELGYEGHVVAPGWIGFQGEWSAVCRANLWLRTASRVLVQVATFAAEDFDTLFETTKALPWHEWLPADAAFPVAGRSIKSQLSSVPACQRSVKKAIVESLLHGHRTSELPESGAAYKIEVALLNNQVTLTIDTTGRSLHKRGYQQANVRTPLRETLAAAMILLSFWDPERPLIDPFCGSGTIPIEAAWIGRRIAPGLHRSFAAEAWANIPPHIWQAGRDEARDVMLPPFSERLLGTDPDERLLELARHNAEQAGVADQLHFQRREFHELSSKRTHGCIVTSLPDEQAQGQWRNLQALYQQIPEVLRKLPTWSHFILTGYPGFESLLQKTADRRRKLYNGRMECTYYQFHGPRPDARVSTAAAVDAVVTADKPDEEVSDVLVEPSVSLRTKPPAVPVFGGLTTKAHEQSELFRSRLEKLARHLRRWPTRQGITCYRLYERDIPEIPLIVDRYEDHLHIAEYERPHERDLGQHADWLDLMARTAAEALQVDRRQVFLKRRLRQRGTVQHEHLADQQYEITVHEGGLQFIVNLSDYVDTGLFLDHRITRSLVRELAGGARVLNLFGYTGAFTVYAAAGGAVQTTTVDWSRTYLEWAQRNMRLNGFTNPLHTYVRDDAREYLQNLPPSTLFDLAIVDPPTFSNSKRTEEVWDVQRDYHDTLTRLLQHVRPGGVVFFSSNFRRFKFDPEAIPAASIFEISRQTVPPDFRNRRIHRCWKIVAR
ncbi:MAG: bifunctional 23S rRNA (guanine(2069)-N(7))-methyltransferase RlmK/23S rRNA (guanine(2445)-N(2))-methyltransferase RlmL [Pirellulaceae bacterium]